MMRSLSLLSIGLLRFFLPMSGSDRRVFTRIYLYLRLIRVLEGFLIRKGTISISAIRTEVEIFFSFEVRSFLLKSIKSIMVV